jgi:hypothetical protein
MRLLEEMEQVRSNSLVFPGYVEGRPLSDKAFERLLRKLGCEATAHGFMGSVQASELEPLRNLVPPCPPEWNI